MSKPQDVSLRPPGRMPLWATKDGENPKEKLKAIWRMGLFTGATYGFLHANHLKMQPPSHEALIHALKSTFFCCGVGTIFVSSSFVSAHIRGKSDVYNTLIGGICTLPAFRTVLSMHTMGAIAPMGLLILVCLRFLYDEYGPSQYHIPRSRTSGFDTFIWAHNKPVGEPFVKYQSDSLFTILQKE